MTEWVFEGRTAVVTGAASGIGRALARGLRDLGANVVLSDLPGDRLNETAAELSLPAVPADVSDPAAVLGLAREAVKRFGTVHLLCNNAGVGTHIAFEQLTLRDWQWMMDVNFWGVVHGVKAFLPIMRGNTDGGHIVNTLSLLSLHGRPGATAYSSSKYAALALTESLAEEEALKDRRIGITAFCPGPVATEIAESAKRRDGRYGRRTPLPEDDAVQRFFRAGERIEHMSETDAAGIAIDAVRKGRFWALTHPELMAPYLQRHANLMAAMNG